MRNGVIAASGFREIEAAQFVIKDAGVADLDGGVAGGYSAGKREYGLLLAGIEGYGARLLGAVGENRYRLEGDFDSVQSNRARGLMMFTSIASSPENVAALRSGVSLRV